MSRATSRNMLISRLFLNICFVQLTHINVIQHLLFSPKNYRFSNFRKIFSPHFGKSTHVSNLLGRHKLRLLENGASYLLAILSSVLVGAEFGHTLLTKASCKKTHVLLAATISFQASSLSCI